MMKTNSLREMALETQKIEKLFHSTIKQNESLLREITLLKEKYESVVVLVREDSPLRVNQNDAIILDVIIMRRNKDIRQ